MIKDRSLCKIKTFLSLIFIVMPLKVCYGHTTGLESLSERAEYSENQTYVSVVSDEDHNPVCVSINEEALLSSDISLEELDLERIKRCETPHEEMLVQYGLDQSFTTASPLIALGLVGGCALGVASSAGFYYRKARNGEHGDFITGGAIATGVWMGLASKFSKLHSLGVPVTVGSTLCTVGGHFVYSFWGRFKGKDDSQEGV